MDLSLKQKEEISKVSGLVLINAMIFQEVLAESNPKVFPLQKILASNNFHKVFSDHWKFIIDKINYYPIFNIARKIVTNLSSNKTVLDTISNLADIAQKIVSMRAGLRHDLMGRIYHRLLSERKYLGTYYTSIPAAIILLKFALYPQIWDFNWDNLDEINKIRISDLACGTGTLLMAAADTITDNYVGSSSELGKEINMSHLQSLLVENVIHGFDVLHSAIHLTASTLSLRAPEIAFSNMNLWCLPLGGAQNRLGSIEFRKGGQIDLALDLYGAKQITGAGAKEKQSAVLPTLDLCVMNPPFTRSVGSNLLFGSLPEQERKATQSKLKDLIKKTKAKASIVAGLGSVFVAVADSYIKPKGRMALVLPKALLSGVSWSQTREILEDNYILEVLISSHDPDRWNFSESTSLSEVLVVAQKMSFKGSDKKGNALVINLWKNPQTVFEAIALSNNFRNFYPNKVEEDRKFDIKIGDNKVGEAFYYPINKLKNNKIWMLPCAFAQDSLIKFADNLLEGNILVPGQSDKLPIPLTPLNELGVLGPDRHGIHANFNQSKITTEYPSLWGHNSGEIFCVDQIPNRYLSARRGEKSQKLWDLSGKLLIAEGIRLNTHKLLSVKLPCKVLSNVWWSFSFNDDLNYDFVEKAMVVWLNSTLGIITLLIHREETEGAWIGFKKTILENLPVINFNLLSKSQLTKLNKTYDLITQSPLESFPEMYHDPVRAEIDKNISDVFGLPDLSVLRQLLSQEPIICLSRL